MEAVKPHFNGFINRVDELVIFMGLEWKRSKAIVEIQVKKLEQRLLERQIRLKMTDKAKEWLCQRGF